MVSLPETFFEILFGFACWFVKGLYGRDRLGPLRGVPTGVSWAKAANDGQGKVLGTSAWGVYSASRSTLNRLSNVAQLTEDL
jgi:hypothetical protein